MDTNKRESRRVLHYVGSEVRGGAEEHALSLVASLRDHGLSPFFAAPQRLLDSMAAELAGAGVPAIAVDTSSRVDVRAARRFAAVLRRERIDILHTHLFASSCFAAPVGRLVGVPAIVETCHGREVWRQGKGVKGRFWFDRMMARLTDRYIAVSHATARYLTETKGIESSKVRVIHNGRDLSRYSPPAPERVAAFARELGLEGRTLLTVVARLDEQKGHAHLLDALSTVLPRWPRVTVLLVGSGPLEAQLRARSAVLGLEQQVKFLGYRADSAEILAASSLVVLPSLYEGLPLVAIEALASARPIVATAVDGTPEVVRDNETGLLVPAGDASALAQAIERMLANPELAARLGEQGRTFVEEHFDVRRQVSETAAMYRDLIDACDQRRGARAAREAVSRPPAFGEGR